ncbi:MAG: tetratricopeptide repeat protein [Thermomicrobiales bacterium]
MNATDRLARDHAAEIAAVLDDGDNESAAELADQALTVFPDAAVFQRLRGVALFALGANAEAKTHLDAALAVDPLDNEAILVLARLADAEGDPYTAAEHLLTAWEHDPANSALRAELTERLAALYGPEGYLQFTRPALAALYVRNLYPERAAREYAAILADHPNRTDLRLAAALAQWRLGNLAETVEQCAALLGERPGIVRARWALADATARRGNGDLAREHAKQAARNDPDGAIARALIASNPDAAIVDPDEPLRLPVHGRQRLSLVPTPQVLPDPEENVMTTEPEARAAAEPSPADVEEPQPKSDTMRLVEALSGLAAALANAKAADPQPEPEPEIVLPHADGLAAAIAALDAPVAALPHPLHVPYAEPEDERALESTPVAADEEPESIMAVVEEDGAIIATQPGGEPLLDATDALPTPQPPPDTGEGAVGAHSRAPSDSVLMPPKGHPQASVLVRARAGDVVGAVGEMRAALTAAGTDHDRLHALLPGLRALVDATPQRPDSRRLLGDAYSRLGLYAQAQGQYRQALLVRVAGKGTGR